MPGKVVHRVKRWTSQRGPAHEEMPVCGAPLRDHEGRTVSVDAVTCRDCRAQADAAGAPALRDELAAVRADADDYRRRWLEECRAHGDTRRALWAAQHELGDHSNCIDCEGDREETGPDAELDF